MSALASKLYICLSRNKNIAEVVGREKGCGRAAHTLLCKIEKNVWLSLQKSNIIKSCIILLVLHPRVLSISRETVGSVQLWFTWWTLHWRKENIWKVLRYRVRVDIHTQRSKWLSSFPYWSRSRQVLGKGPGPAHGPVPISSTLEKPGFKRNGKDPSLCNK